MLYVKIDKYPKQTSSYLVVSKKKILICINIRSLIMTIYINW